MSKLARTLCLCTAIFSAKTVAAEPATLCHASETVLFNCALRDSTKVVSLCSSGDSAKPWLQYRMGRPGRKLDLVVPGSLDDPGMSSMFFYDLPSATRDGSYAQLGIWFRHADSVYELVTSQNHQFQEGPDDMSKVDVWTGKVNEAPIELICRKPSSSALLRRAGELVEAIAPGWHHWSITPYDWEIHFKTIEERGRTNAETAPVVEGH